MSTSILNKLRGKNHVAVTPVGQVFSKLKDQVSGIQDSFSNESSGWVNAAVGQGVSETVAARMEEFGSTIDSSIESLYQEMNLGAPSRAAKDAFAMASMMALNPRQAFNQAREKRVAQGSDSTVIVDLNVGDEANYQDLGMALEAYDEQSLRTTTVYSQQLNLRPGNQDEFGETLFPTVVVPNDQAGYAVSLPIVQVQDDITRHLDGRLNDFRRRALVHARIDPTILRDDETKLIPIHRTETAHLFVDAALLTPRTVMQGGVAITTSALKVGAQFSILGISQSDAQIGKVGALTIEDAVASGTTIEALYIKVAKADGTDPEVIKLDTRGVDTNNFWTPPQGTYRTVRLAFDSKAVTLRGTVKQADGSNSALLAAIGTNNLAINLAMELSGKIVTDTGDTTTSAPNVRVDRIFDVTNLNEIALTDAGVAVLVATLNKAEIIGYDLDGARTNSNRRNRGQLLNNELYTQIYPTKRRAPLTVPRPQVDSPEAREATDLAALLEGVGSRTSASAVQALHNANEILKANVVNDDILGARPNILGIAHSTIRAYYHEDTIDMEAELQTLTSTDKVRDICNAFINRIRDQVFKAYVSTGYKATADARFGNRSPKPLVIIATDPRLAAYMQIIGDERTLGDEFKYKVVSTLNKTMNNIVYVTFGMEEALTSGQAEPLHFGNMGWTTPLVYTLPTHSNGSNSNQTTVQPDYIHVTNLPILIRFNVKGLEKAIVDRIPVKTVSP